MGYIERIASKTIGREVSVKKISLMFHAARQTDSKKNGGAEHLLIRFTLPKTTQLLPH